MMTTILMIVIIVMVFVNFTFLYSIKKNTDKMSSNLNNKMKDLIEYVDSLVSYFNREERATKRLVSGLLDDKLIELMVSDSDRVEYLLKRLSDYTTSSTTERDLRNVMEADIQRLKAQSKEFTEADLFDIERSFGVGVSNIFKEKTMRKGSNKESGFTGTF